MKLYTLPTINVNLAQTIALRDNPALCIPTTGEVLSGAAMTEIAGTHSGEPEVTYPLTMLDGITCSRHGSRDRMILVEAERTSGVRALDISACCQGDIGQGMRPVTRCRKCITRDKAIPVLATFVGSGTTRLYWRNRQWTRYKDGPRASESVIPLNQFTSWCPSHSVQYRTTERN